MPMSTDAKVGAAIAAGSIFASLFGAKKAADASKDAAAIQVAASDKAQAFNERVYADQQKALAPYQAAGASSLAGLQQYLAQPFDQRVTGHTIAAQHPATTAAGYQSMPQGGTSLAAMQEQAAAPQPAAPDPASFTAGMAQRGGGGGVLKGAMTGAGLGMAVPGVGNLVGGAVGAAAGAIGGLINKHAASAKTDYSVADATKAITNAYTAYNGRPPAAGEVDTILRGQGWKPGDQYVGSGGLTSVLQTLKSNAAGAQAPQSSPTSLAALQGAQQPAQGGMVKLQGPDGSMRDVPAELADQFIAKGARRVG